MSRPSILIVLGILTILTPFSGLPIAFRTLFTVIFGACMLVLGLSLRMHRAQNPSPPIEEKPPVPPHNISPT